ncbi:MAG: DUF6531 domain-containing protein, partial [Kiritimatiellia bacterium]
MNKLLLMLGALAIASTPLFAQEEVEEYPGGWFTRGPDALPSGTNAPIGLPSLEPREEAGFFTMGLTPPLGFPVEDIDLGLSSTMPATDFARIKELARGLDYDWEKCCRFVRDNIDYAPYAGIMRGPERTLLDREGNDADQAFLLLALLRASGWEATVIYEPYDFDGTNYYSGFYAPLYNQQGLYPNNAAAWLDVPVTGTVATVSDKVRRTLTSSGRPASEAQAGGVPCIVTDHFWVELTIDGETLALDPSFKPTVRASGRPIPSDMGYGRADTIAAAGGLVNAQSVSNLSVSGLETKLNALTASLRGAWTNANASVADYLGESRIAPWTDADHFHGYTISFYPFDFLAFTEATRNAFRASLTIKHGTNMTQQLYLDELGARGLWLSFTAVAGYAYPKPVLHLDDTVLTSSVASASAPMTLRLKVACVPAPMTADYALTRGVSNVYAIPVGFGGDARGGMRTWATEELAKLRAAGVSSSNSRMIARALQVAGHQWLSQTALAMKMRNRVNGGDHRSFYTLGVAGQAKAPYVDMKNSFSYSTSDPAVFDGGMLFNSALEHAVLDQLNGTNKPSVSTVKLLELASLSGYPIFFANASNFASTVSGQLYGYTTAQVDAFQTAVNAGRVLLLPYSGSLTLNAWTGCGYIEHGPSTNGIYITGMTIGGGMNGGFGTVDNVVDEVAYTTQTQPTTYYGNGGVRESVQADPVAMPAGAYLDSRTDLTVGGGRPLAWTRRYDSRGRYDDGALGRGWSHGFDASVVETADPDAVFGRGSLEAAIPTVVAMTVVDDMLAKQATVSAGENARRWTIAALTVQWWTRQLVGATASVNLGARSLSFQRRPDGGYSPWPGVTDTLTRSNGLFYLTERHGNVYAFNASGKLASVTDRSGNDTTLSYTNGKLVRVANEFGAAFDIAWNGEHIASFSDNTGRSVEYTYNTNGCLTRVTDPEDQKWKAAYDTNTFALLTQTDPGNLVSISNVYNVFGQVTNQTSAAGQPWKFGYAASVEAWDEDPFGQRLTQSYTDDGRVRRRTERDGAMTDYAYDGHGHVVARMDALERIDFYDYDRNDNLIRSIEAGMRTNVFLYDAANRLIAATNAMGETTRFAYDAQDRLLLTVFPDGTSVSNAWTTHGMLQHETARDASGVLLRRAAHAYTPTNRFLGARTVTGTGLSTSVVERYGWSPAGFLLRSTNANGRLTCYTYNNRGQVLTVQDPDNRVETRAYTGAGRLLSVQDALGRVTSNRWTASGNLASVRLPDGGLLTNEYDAADRLARVTDPRGASVDFTRDAEGRVLARATAAGTEAFAYNPLGLLTETMNGAGVWRGVWYDWLYRPILAQNALDREWWTDHDLLDRPIASIDPLGKTWTTAYDSGGRKTATARPSGATDRFGYDALGRLTAHTNAEGHVYTLAVDALGRVTAATNALGEAVFRVVYDGVGHETWRVDGAGNTATSVYDVCDRLVRRVAHSPEGASDTAQFAYDAVHNLVLASNAVAQERFGYDSLDRLTAATTTVGGVSFANQWRRDLGGLVTNVVYAPGKSLTRTYDTDGRLVGVSDWLGHTWTFAWDGAGKPTGGTAPGGISFTNTFDSAGQMSGWSVGTLAGRTIERDAAGKRVRDTITAGSMPAPSFVRYADNTFDAADRLTAAQVRYGSHTNEAVTEIYDYDPNGALTNVISNATNVFWAAYDPAGRLGSLQNGAGGPSAVFAYDALGNRVGEGDRLWIPDHADPLKRPLFEADTNGAPVRYYIWGPGRLLGFVDASNDALTVVHSDEQGSVIALTDETGSTLHTAHYGPNGQDWGRTGTNETPFAWLGGHGVQRVALSAQLGPLYLTRHRLYAASLNRFLSADPLGISGGLNLYAYAEGNPLA